MRQMNATGEDGKDNIIWFRPVDKPTISLSKKING